MPVFVSDHGAMGYKYESHYNYRGIGAATASTAMAVPLFLLSPILKNRSDISSVVRRATNIKPFTGRRSWPFVEQPRLLVSLDLANVS